MSLLTYFHRFVFHIKAYASLIYMRSISYYSHTYALFTRTTLYSAAVWSSRFNGSALLAHRLTFYEAGPDVSLIVFYPSAMTKAEHVAVLASAT